MHRTTITVVDDLERRLSAFTRPGPYREGLYAWARARGLTLSDSPAEAALIRVLMEAGIEQVRAFAADVAYRELAGVYLDEGIGGEVAAFGDGDPGSTSPRPGDGSGDGADGDAPDRHPADSDAGGRRPVDPGRPGTVDASAVGGAPRLAGPLHRGLREEGSGRPPDPEGVSMGPARRGRRPSR